MFILHAPRAIHNGDRNMTAERKRAMSSPPSRPPRRDCWSCCGGGRRWGRGWGTCGDPSRCQPHSHSTISSIPGTMAGLETDALADSRSPLCFLRMWMLLQASSDGAGRHTGNGSRERDTAAAGGSHIPSHLLVPFFSIQYLHVAIMPFIMKTIYFIVCQKRITILIYTQRRISFSIKLLWRITSFVVGVIIPEH